MDHRLVVEAQFLSDSWDKTKPFKDSLLVLMREARKGGHMGWLMNEQEYFTVAVVAAALVCEEEDKMWLQSQMKGLQKFSAVVQAAHAGVPIDLEQFADSMKEVPKVDREYKLLDLWHQSKDG